MEQEGYWSERAAAHPCPVPLCLSLAPSWPEEEGLEVQSQVQPQFVLAPAGLKL